ncbi:MAG: twin-arginine translocase subunit TatC [Acidimicrobiia bacterium]
MGQPEESHQPATDRPQSILAHLEELRWRLVKTAVAVLAGAIVAFAFAQRIFGLLQRPYELAFPGEAELVGLAPTEQFSVFMRIALFGGVVIASPVILYQVWGFVSPALTRRERRWVVPIIVALTILFMAGVAFGFWILPRGLEFLLGIFPDVASQLRIGDYISFVLRFLLAFGVAFEFPVFLFALAAFGVLSSQTLARGRRWAVLIIVIASAMITPTGDPLTLLALSAPLYLFYEVTYWLVRLVLRR